jgi:hypothetical protein
MAERGEVALYLVILDLVMPEMVVVCDRDDD